MTFSSNKSEGEKIRILFSISFLHFYTYFTYDNTFSFDDYFNQNLINLCTKYGIFIKDLKQFKIYCYSFYSQLTKEIKNFNYFNFKQMYRYYSISALEEEKILNLSKRKESSESKSSFKNSKDQDIKENNKLNEIIDILKTYIRNITTLDYDRLKFGLTNINKVQNILPLVSTTERIVDMVLSVN